MESSGGHQPWHRPTYIYSRSARAFFALDDYVGAVTSDFEVTGDTIAVSRLTAGSSGADERVVFALSRLGRARPGSRPN
jgi:hypothetical protein